MPKYDVYVYLPTKLVGEDFEYEYVSATSADPGEIVASIQVLYPEMVGIEIRPFKVVTPELHDYSDRVNK